MNQNIVLSIIEFVASTAVEGIILAGVFNWISDKNQQKQQEMLAQEMNNIEKQNKFDYEQFQKSIQTAKTEIISQIKESSKKG
jgi:esterase/lipase